jgi:putative GTP pyrophosphokinase
MTEHQNPDQKEVERRYREEYYPLYKEFASRLQGLLKELTHDLGTLIDKIEYRAKTVESFIGKIERKSYKYKNPFTEITDLAGVRIITFYQESVPKIVDIIRREFEIDEENSLDKFDNLGADEFGYRSVHLIVLLSKSRSELKEWKRFAGLKAEIQVRSILQHAWANMSHKFDYKVTSQAPREIRRRLFRLSALLELADEEFKALLDQSQEITKGYQSEMSKGELNLPLNLDSLREFIHQRVDLRKWERFGINAGMERFSAPESARKYFPTGLEILLLTLQTVGISTIAEFERLLPGFDNMIEQLRTFVDLVKVKGETVDSLPLEILILLVSFLRSNSIPDKFNWGGRYKNFYIEALREALRNT